MYTVYHASVKVDGTKVMKDFRDEELASMWLRLMTAQYMGRVSSPSLTCTTYSDIFKTPMSTRGVTQQNADE